MTIFFVLFDFNATQINSLYYKGLEFENLFTLKNQIVYLNTNNQKGSLVIFQLLVELGMKDPCCRGQPVMRAVSIACTLLITSISLLFCSEKHLALHENHSSVFKHFQSKERTKFKCCLLTSGRKFGLQKAVIKLIRSLTANILSLLSCTTTLESRLLGTFYTEYISCQHSHRLLT